MTHGKFLAALESVLEVLKEVQTLAYKEFDTSQAQDVRLSVEGAHDRNGSVCG